MRINTNVMALNAQNKLTGNQLKVEKSIQKLSSGLRINSASDDAAGLAISEKMRAQIRGLSQAQSNAQDGISLIQTAEGALQQTTDILQRMRELVIKAQNTGVLTDNDRTSISTELSTLRDEIDRIATSTTFNSRKLLNGDMATEINNNGFSTLASSVNVANALEGTTYTVSKDLDNGKLKMTWSQTINGVKKDMTAYSDITFTSSGKIKGQVTFADAGIVINFGKNAVNLANDTDITTKTDAKRANFKIGANTNDEDILAIGIADMSSEGLRRKVEAGKKLEIDISTAANANTALNAIDYAIEKVSSQRATLGTVQNRMEYAISNLSTTEENLTAAESRIRDVDMAEEMVSYTKNSILNQSAMAMLSQANQQPQSILALLQ